MDLSITTSRRLSLFNTTIASLCDHCTDLNLIDRVLLIDDGSIDGEVQWMSELLAAKVCKNVIVSVAQAGFPTPIGLTPSLQRWFDLVRGDYCFALEDDFEFVRPFSIGEIVERFWTLDGCGIGQIALSRSGEEHGAENLNGYWLWNRPEQHPHYTTNTQIVDLSAIRKVGKMEVTNTNWVFQPTDEFVYGMRWLHHGYKTAYTWEKICNHIGSGKSAYTLNGTKR